MGALLLPPNWAYFSLISYSILENLSGVESKGFYSSKIFFSISILLLRLFFFFSPLFPISAIAAFILSFERRNFCEFLKEPALSKFLLGDGGRGPFKSS